MQRSSKFEAETLLCAAVMKEDFKNFPPYAPDILLEVALQPV